MKFTGRISRLFLTFVMTISGIASFAMPENSCLQGRMHIKAAREVLPPAEMQGPVTIEDMIPSENKADFKRIDYRGPKGEKCSIRLDGSKIVYETNRKTMCDLLIISYFEGEAEVHHCYEDSGSFDIKGKLDADKVYYIDLLLDYPDYQYYDINPIISCDDKGDLFFVEPPALEINRKKLEKLYYFDDPYEYFLGPQTDIEIDNPDVRREALDICRGLKDDYAKVGAIYSFVVDEMYYDNDQLSENFYDVYEDDVLTLLRSKVGVCEGFSNVFVALCRANGIPATEIHGSSYDWEVMVETELDKIEYGNHAWVAYYVDGQWFMADPTMDNYNTQEDGEYTKGTSTRDYFFVPLESLSYSHIIINADFSHSLEAEGSCGPDANYKIGSDGVCTIYGSGEICMPADAKDFFELRFDKDSDITAIGVNAFADCDLLRNAILPDSIEDIGEAAFCSCEDLEYVRLPSGLKIIRNSAFVDCDKLAYVSVPDGTVIDRYAFNGCPRLVIEVEDSYSIDTRNYTTDPARIIPRK